MSQACHYCKEGEGGGEEVGEGVGERVGGREGDAKHWVKLRNETYLIPGETLIPGGRGEAFHPGIGYAT